MAEEKMMRLNKVANKLGLGVTSVVEKLVEMGQRVDNNPNTKINFEQLQILSKVYKNNSLLQDEAAPAKPAEEQPVVSSRRDDSEILYYRNEPAVAKDQPEKVESVQKPTVEIEKAVEPSVVAQQEPVKAVQPIQVVEPPKVEPIAPLVVEVKAEARPIVAETVAEKPKVTEVAVAPKQEEPTPNAEQSKDEVIRATAQPAGLKVLGKIDLEVTKKPTQQQRPDNRDNRGGQRPDNRGGQRTDQRPDNRGGQRPDNRDNRGVGQRPDQRVDNRGGQRPDNRGNGQRPAEQKPFVPAPQAQKIPPPPVVIEEEDEVEVMRAKGEQLKGLTVLGKIQLPVERKPGSGNNDRDGKKRKRKRISKEPEKVNITVFNKDDKSKPAGSTPGNTNTPGNRPGQPNTNNNNAGAGRNDKAKGGKKKDQFTEGDVKDNIKKTMATLNQKGNDFGSKYRKDKRKNRAEQEELRLQNEEIEKGILKVTEFISVAELASLMDASINEVISKCMGMGMFVSINLRLDAEQIQLIALEFGFDVQFISAEEEIKADVTVVEDAPEDLTYRAPIVTIMGHVDHGKTSLLDFIRRTKVAAGEAGGITQHIGAYSVNMNEGPNKGKKVTFLDTPGHEAFTAMRARGAKVTDIVIVVVAADDSVMPQTREAINHAQNAGVPIVIAINKIDKDGANPAKIREDLAKENVLVESWGGKYQDQEISAKKGLGIDELLDKVILEAEMLDLKANKNRAGIGTVIEASLDKGRGYVTTILVETGTMKVGDVILAGQFFGRVRAMINDKGERIKEAGPSTPVQILGLPGAPQAGDKFNIMDTEREAREIASKREQILREQSIRAKKHITLDEIGRRKAIGNFQQLNLIVKADFDGSVEALSDSLQKLSTEEVHVSIIHKAVGQISESDVLLASAGDAIIIGFQVRPSVNARKLADQEQIEIKSYSVIYAAIEEIKEAMTGMLAPKIEEVITGNIEIREIFKISKVGTIAGCYVLDGNVKRNNKIRIIREGIVVHEGEISQLKRFKDDVQDVRAGYECGLSIKNYNDIQQYDIIESYELKEVKRTL